MKSRIPEARRGRRGEAAAIEQLAAKKLSHIASL
jgi:hypothetical protein